MNGPVHPLVADLRALHDAPAPLRFAQALVLPVRAAVFLAGQRRLWPFVVLPALVNLVLFGLALFLALRYVGVVVEGVWDRPVVDVFYEWLLLGLWYVLYALLVALSVVIAFVVVLLLGGIVASPFNDALSERVERILTGRREVPQAGDTFVGGVFKSMGSAAVITGLYLVLFLPVLLLHLVPGGGTLAATVLGAGLSAFFLALEYTDTTLVRYGFGVRQKIRLMRTHLALAGGFGLGASLLLWVPVLNVFCIPVAVVAGTALALSLPGVSNSG